jgi:protein-S-isoprenylcysteine O-methyltransferase Ste14/uncharacterized membrane protein (UPF0127 family)
MMGAEIGSAGLLDGTHRARDAASGTLLADRLRAAHTPWRRLKGLLGTRGLAPGEGLWLRPCNQVHMIGMRYPVDVAFLDPGHRVLHTVSELPPNTLSPRIVDAVSVLELPAGTLARTGLREGSQVEIDGEAPAEIDAVGPTMPGATFAFVVSNFLLATLYGFFAFSHLVFARRTGQWATTVPIVTQEALLVFLFLTRRRSAATSARPIDWALGVVGTFVPLLMRTTEDIGPLAWLGQPVQAAGLALSVVAVLSLGRSVGVVAADRGVKTNGLYRVVRHPLYAAYLVSYLGYVASYPSLRNCSITLVTFVAMNARAIIEERFLARDAGYRAFLKRTRWRFIPGLY